MNQKRRNAGMLGVGSALICVLNRFDSVFHCSFLVTTCLCNAHQESVVYSDL